MNILKRWLCGKPKPSPVNVDPISPALDKYLNDYVDMQLMIRDLPDSDSLRISALIDTLIDPDLVLSAPVKDVSRRMQEIWMEKAK